MSWLADDEVGRVHDVDRQEPHVVVAVEPLVELGRAERERADREPVERALAHVRDLAGTVQLHEPGREHLGVHAVVAAVAARRATRRWSTGSRRCRSATCSRRGRRSPRAPAIACSTSAGGGSVERERRPVALDEHVDGVDVDAVRVLGRESERAREVRVRLDDQQPVRIARRRAAISRTVAPACSDRLIQPSASGGVAAVATTRGANCSAIVTKRRKSAGTNSMRGAGVDEHAFGRPEEAADVADAGLGEQRIEVEQRARRRRRGAPSRRAPPARGGATAGWPGPSGMPKVSRGRNNATASAGVHSSSRSLGYQNPARGRPADRVATPRCTVRMPRAAVRSANASLISASGRRCVIMPSRSS